MSHPDPTRQLFLDYLLEKLSPADRERVDDALLEDQNFSFAFKEIEYTLLDELASKSLTSVERGRVEEALLKFPHLQEAIKMANAFRRVHMISTASPVLKAPPVPYKRSWWHSPLLLSSALAVMVICFLLSVRQMNLHFNTAAQTSAEPPAKGTPSKTSPPALGSQGTLAAASSEAPASGSTLKQSPTVHRNQRDLVAVLLLPELVRGQQSLNLDLRGDVRTLQVQYPIPADSSEESYTMDAVNVDSGQVFNGNPNPATTIGGRRIAMFSFETAGIVDGQYQFRLHNLEGTSTFNVSIKTIR